MHKPPASVSTPEGIASALPQVYALLADVIDLPDVDPEYLAALHRALDAAEDSERAGVTFTALPLLACQAAGGQPHLALPAAAAWRALHIAVQLIDDLGRDDPPGAARPPADTAQVLNLSTGFVVAANLALARLPPALWPTLQSDFSRTILRMAGGQHADLGRRAAFDLDECFQVMAARSGGFFALSARAGAACGTTDQSQIAKYDLFGYNVGILIQIIEDLSDFHRPIGRGDLARGLRTLPALYALSVASPPERTRLDQLLTSVRVNKEAEPQARQLMVALGAEVYLRAETTHYRDEALSALMEPVRVVSSADRSLSEWLEAISRPS